MIPVQVNIIQESSYYFEKQTLCNRNFSSGCDVSIVQVGGEAMNTIVYKQVQNTFIPGIRHNPYDLHGSDNQSSMIQTCTY